MLRSSVHHYHTSSLTLTLTPLSYSQFLAANVVGTRLVLVLSVAQLLHVAKAPRVEKTLLVHCQQVVVSARNLLDLDAFRELHLAETDIELLVPTLASQLSVAVPTHCVPDYQTFSQLLHRSVVH